MAGVILDSSIIIAAERRGQTVLQILEGVRASQGDTEVGVSVVTIAELVHGAYRAKTTARQEVILPNSAPPSLAIASPPPFPAAKYYPPYYPNAARDTGLSELTSRVDGPSGR